MKSLIVRAGVVAFTSGLIMAPFARAEGVEVDTESKVQAIVESYTDAFANSEENATFNNSDDSLLSHKSKSGRLKRIAVVRKVCGAVQATDEQKASIRDEAFGFKEKSLPLEAAAKARPARGRSLAAGSDSPFSLQLA